MKTRGLALSLILVLLVALAGCGGDDKPEGTPTKYEHTDAELGHSFEVLSAQFDVEIDDPDLAAENYDRLVLVELNVQAGDVYRNDSNPFVRFRLSDGTNDWKSNEILAAAGEGAGHEMLPEQIASGSTATGHLLFGIHGEVAGDLVLAYDRPELEEIMGGDKVIAAKLIEVPLS